MGKVSFLLKKKIENINYKSFQYFFQLFVIVCLLALIAICVALPVAEPERKRLS